MIDDHYRLGDGHGPDGTDWNNDQSSYLESKTTSSGKTGISASATVTNKYVSSSYRTGSETRPKNMNVIWIIRVF